MKKKKHIDDREKALNLIKRGADMLKDSKEEVHLPDGLVQISGGEYELWNDEGESGQDIEEHKLADLIRYLADMMQ